jgi:hypothetical protein
MPRFVFIGVRTVSVFGASCLFFRAADCVQVNRREWTGIDRTRRRYKTKAVHLLSLVRVLF